MEKIDLEKFNKDGYLIVDNVFSMKEMDLLNNVVKDILLYKYNNIYISIYQYIHTYIYTHTHTPDKSRRARTRSASISDTRKKDRSQLQARHNADIVCDFTIFRTT